MNYLKKWLAVLAVAFTMIMPVSAYGQAVENLPHSQALNVSRGTHGSLGEELYTDDILTSAGPGISGTSIDEHSRLVKNEVNMTARHCQNYEKKVGFFHRHWVIDADACAKDPSTVYYSETNFNLRTNAGGDWQASVMGNTAAPPATCTYIALSNDATAPSTSDTSVASEIATNGLSRAQATYAHTGGTSSFTEQKVFSATGTQASQKAGLLNASSSGTLCFENTYTQVTVNNGDTLTVTWTINY